MLLKNLLHLGLTIHPKETSEHITSGLFGCIIKNVMFSSIVSALPPLPPLHCCCSLITGKRGVILSLSAACENKDIPSLFISAAGQNRGCGFNVRTHTHTNVCTLCRLLFHLFLSAKQTPTFFSPPWTSRPA